MALALEWPPNKPFVEPTQVQQAGDAWKQPAAKLQPPQIAPHMHGLRTDDEFDDFMKGTKGNRPVLVQFGSTWCVKCHEFFPTFFTLSKKYNQVTYAVAQVDYMKERAKSIRYSPTFAFFRNGKKVDELVGKDAQKLEDHLWLQSD